MGDLFGWVLRSKIAWLFLVVILIFTWLFKGNGFYQIATVVSLVSGTRLVGPPVEFAELCEKYAGVNVYQTVSDVNGIFYVSSIFTKARENEMELPVIGIPELLGNAAELDGIVPLLVRGPGPSQLRSLLERYEFVETMARPNDRSLSELSMFSQGGLYRFSRGRRDSSEVCQSMRRIIEQDRNMLGEELAAQTGTGNICILVEKIQSVSARWEYISFVSGSDFFIYETAISNGSIGVERKVARDFATGEIVADATNFNWTDSVRGGRFDRPDRPCNGVGTFPYVTKVFLPHDEAS